MMSGTGWDGMGWCCCHLLQHTVNFTATWNMQQTPRDLLMFSGTDNHLQIVFYNEARGGYTVFT